MSYFLLTGFLVVTAVGWGAPAFVARFVARVALAMAVSLAVQTWWGL